MGASHPEKIFRIRKNCPFPVSLFLIVRDLSSVDTGYVEVSANDASIKTGFAMNMTLAAKRIDNFQSSIDQSNR